ncbi:MAG: LysM peptidoglycan-binding domain-containing protein [Bacillota bacterium]|jgi:membrane-bound lytic murein transglycosylase D
MKRFATVVGLALVSACAGQRHAPPTEVAPAAAPSSPAATRASSAARTDPARHAPNPDSIVVPPAPSVDTRIDAEVAAELNVAADSAADAEMLEKLDASRPSGKDDATLPDAAAHSPGGGVTWDIDVASFNNHDRVQYYLDLFQGPARERMGIWLNRMPRYESMIRERLQEQGLPGDMVYLALIESGFSNVATSSARAVGMWQFMRATGRGYGLRIDGWVDERRDPVKSTIAATRFLHDLRERFGSLYLAAAAYNAGAGKVGRGLDRMADDEDDEGYSDSTFFRLYDTDFIRRETKDYVPKLIAAALIAKEPARYGFHVAPAGPLVTDSIVVPDMTGLDVVARLADTTVAAIAELNPQYLRLATPPHARSVVRLPAGSGERTATAYAELPASQRVSFVEHVVTRGQTSAAIARRYGISTSSLIEANPRLRRHAPRAGQRVIVPLDGPMSTVVARRIAEPEPSEVQFHRVRRGETLSHIARRYHLSQRQLRAWNHLGAKSRLRAGQRLRVSPPAAQRAKQASRKIASKGSTTHVTRLAGKAGGVSHPAAARRHVVRRGETLTGLARRYGVSVQALMSANGMSARSQLKAGTAIRIPA